jgi:type II secretory pathway pseudopilin PulG
MRYGNTLRRRQGRGTPRPEDGYILIIFLVMLTMMIIALTAAAPKLAQQIQRDREIEMIHRGEQYERAIKRFYKKFGRYPNRIEDLENTNTLRFLRKRYKDPITGGPWRLVRYGEIQLLSSGGVGTPPQLVGQATTPQAAGAQSGLFNMNFGATAGQQNPATAAAGANAAATPGGMTATSGTAAGPGVATTDTTDATSGTTATTGSTGQSTSLFGQSATGSPGQTTSSSGSLFSSPATSAQPGGGGGPVIGVASLSKKKGIHEFNKKSAYNDWMFVYDPAQDRGQLLRGPYNPQAFIGQATGTPAGTPAGISPSGSGAGIPSTFAPSNTFGPSSTFGSPGATGTSSPTAPSPAPGSPGSSVPSTQ